MPSDGKIRCPSCNGLDIRHSFQRGIVDGMMSMMGRTPHRCRCCERRFYVHNALARQQNAATVTEPREAS